MTQRGRPRTFDKNTALARAMEMFWAKGYEGASMADLTRAMGIVPTSLYAAFGSKEALFRDAVTLYASTEGQEIWQAVKNAPTAFEAIQHFLLRSADSYTRRGKPTGCLVVLSALHPTEASKTVRRELMRLRAKTAVDLVACLRRGVESGELAADIDLKAIANYYVTVQRGMSIQARDGATQKTLYQIAQAALAAWKSLTQPPQP